MFITGLDQTKQRDLLYDRKEFHSDATRLEKLGQQKTLRQVGNETGNLGRNYASRIVPIADTSTEDVTIQAGTLVSTVNLYE